MSAAYVDSATEYNRALPGQGSMWFFVLGDLWIFACYFLCYAYDRGQYHALFSQGQAALSKGIGVLNTLILLTSSLFVALAVNAVREKQIHQTQRYLQLGAALGIAFLFIKAFEWYAKVDAGLPPGTDSFFIYYFMFTGLHFLHVCLGLVFLTLMYRQLLKPQCINIQFMESGALYWHMVDLLWIVIFALLYLMR